MKKICGLVVVSLWICCSARSALAQDAAPQPVTVKVGNEEIVHEPAPVSCGCGATGCVGTAGCAGGPRSLAAATQTDCCARLCAWLCYKPLPVPCNCQCCCCAGCGCGTCGGRAPEVWAFFHRPCCGAGCNGGCQSGPGMVQH